MYSRRKVNKRRGAVRHGHDLRFWTASLGCARRSLVVESRAPTVRGIHARSVRAST
jgi:hypothetical protein